MRVAALIGKTTGSGGGMATAAIGLYRGLTARGVDVTIFSDSEHHIAGLKTQFFKVLGPRRFEYSADLGKLLDDGRFDIVHTHGLWTFRSAAALRWHRRTKRPLVVSPHGTLDAWALRRSAWKKAIVRRIFEGRHLDSAACIHALNQSELLAIRDYGLTGPVVVIPNGVDVEALETRGEAPSWKRQDDRRTLLFLGRIHPKKGLRELIAAWRMLLDANSEVGSRWRLVIAGWDDGHHQAGLEESVSSLALADHVSFVGPVFDDAKRQAFLASDAFILPSHSEGLPMAVLEAWAHELPVLMTDECNLPAGFEEGAAFRIQTMPAALATELERLLSDEAALQEAGKRGRDLVTRSYSWSQVAERMHKVYTDVLGAGLGR